jgi:ComF family protein
VVKVLPQLTLIKRAALDLFFPQKCVGCGKEGSILCRDCNHSLTRIVPPVCPKCGRPQASEIICPNCVSWQNSINGIRSPYKYEGIIREAVHQLKYKNIRCLAGPLAGLLYDYLKTNPHSFQVIVPVPLSSKRLRERGYNQSNLLAKELSRLTDIPEDTNSLKRVKHVLPQVRTKSVEERYRNVDKAFICDGSKIQKVEVLLIDDVSTSGATLDACAKALKAAGSSSVWGLVLARDIMEVDVCLRRL